MPLYDYHCPNCGHVYESLHARGDAPTPCPKCGNTDPLRMVSRAAFVVRGFREANGYSNAGGDAGGNGEPN